MDKKRIMYKAIFLAVLILQSVAVKHQRYSDDSEDTMLVSM
jgi:hypothetical protein